MPLVEPTFAPYGDHSIAYYAYGDPSSSSEALVFIHGWTCDSSLYSAQTPLFTKYPRAILVDMLGHGASSAPEGVDYSMETLARSIKAALDHAQVKRAVFVSHSMGGPATTTLMRLFPGLVKGIVYVDSFFTLPEHYKSERELADYRAFLTSDANFERWVRAICLSPEGGSTTEWIVKRMLSTSLHVRLSAVTTTSRAMAWRFDEKYEIPAVQIGTVMREADAWWKWHMPRIEVVTEGWEGCRHWPMMEEPGRFNAFVEGWIGGKGLL